MHPSAMENGRLFFETYVRRLGQATVVEIGSQDVNGSLRDVCPPNTKYIGLDFQEAKGVDVLLTDPYSLPFEDESVDVVVSSSCLEHSEMFWLVFTEVLRILKPDGLFYLNVPSNGSFHRYPVDCWRFYPDAGDALVSWGKRCGYRPALLESYVGAQDAGEWNDFVAIFVKDESQATLHPYRIASQKTDLENNKMWGEPEIFNKIGKPQDMRHISELNGSLLKARQNAAAQAKQFAQAQNQMQLALDKTVKEAKEALDEAQRCSQEALNQAQNQIRDIQEQNARLADHIEKLEGSRSWRVTAPLRAIKRRVSRN